MIPFNFRNFLLATCVVLGAIAAKPESSARAADPEKDDAKAKARLFWENVVVFYGQEDTGEWSLRIQDKDVKNRAWFDMLELWHFNREKMQWDQLKIEKISKAIVLPSQKTSDEAPDSQLLFDLKEVPPHTAGVWFAKWKVDEVDGNTLMRVGTSRTTNKVEKVIPDGMMKMAVPINLDKSEAMIVPDPRVYCISGGPGKPDGSNTKKTK